MSSYFLAAMKCGWSRDSATAAALHDASAAVAVAAAAPAAAPASLVPDEGRRQLHEELLQRDAAMRDAEAARVAEYERLVFNAGLRAQRAADEAAARGGSGPTSLTGTNARQQAHASARQTRAGLRQRYGESFLFHASSSDSDDGEPGAAAADVSAAAVQGSSVAAVTPNRAVDTTTPDVSVICGTPAAMRRHHIAKRDTLSRAALSRRIEASLGLHIPRGDSPASKLNRTV